MKNFIEVNTGQGRPVQHINVQNIEMVRKAGPHTVIRLTSGAIVRDHVTKDEVLRKIEEAQFR